MLQAAAPVQLQLPAPPAVHDTQLPPEQTWLFPQLVPSATLVPVAAHTDAPLAHVVEPFWHTLPFGWQLVPVMQATQLPPLQTWPVPHDVPSATFEVKPHVETPVLQDVWPF